MNVLRNIYKTHWDDKVMVILPELESCIDSLTDEEYNNLEKNILNNGVRDALVFWYIENKNRFILVDGHNRASISKRHNLSFDILVCDFKDIEAVKNWMLENQLSRRNLTEAQKSYYRGKLYQEQKNSHGGDRKSESKVQNEPLMNEKPKSTAEQLGEKFGVSDSTIKRDSDFAENLDKLCKYAKNPSKLKSDILNKNILVGKKQIAQVPHLTLLELNVIAEGLEKGQSADLLFPKELKIEEKPENTSKNQSLPKPSLKSLVQKNEPEVFKQDGYYYYDGKKDGLECWFLVLEASEGFTLVIDYYVDEGKYGINTIDASNSQFLAWSSACKNVVFDEALLKAYAFFTQYTKEPAEVMLGKGHIQITKQMFDEMQEKSRELRIMQKNTLGGGFDVSRKKLEKAGFTLIRSDCSRTKPFLKKYQNGTWVKIEAFETKVEMEKRMKELELDDTIIFD